MWKNRLFEVLTVVEYNFELPSSQKYVLEWTLEAKILKTFKNIQAYDQSQNGDVLIKIVCGMIKSPRNKVSVMTRGLLGFHNLKVERSLIKSNTCLNLKLPITS